jgi:hypothetical protein
VPRKPYVRPLEIYTPIEQVKPPTNEAGYEYQEPEEEPLHPQQPEEPLLQLTPETEAPSSLQAILSNHQVKTNFLKTPPRTEHFGYQTVTYRPKTYQPDNMMTLLTPNEEVEHYPSHYQELAERFYTSSGEAKIGPSLGNRNSESGTRNPVSFATQDSADDRISDEEEADADQSKVEEAESKESPLVNTAVIALKLSAKILDLYKTVSPYLPA